MHLSLLTVLQMAKYLPKKDWLLFKENYATWTTGSQAVTADFKSTSEKKFKEI